MKIKLFLIIILISVVSTTSYSQELEEIVAMMSDTLKLTEDQSAEMTELMTLYRGELDRTLAKYEEQEEPDPAAMIGEIRGIRDEYRKKLSGVLSKDQMNGYLGIIDGVMGGMFEDIAEIRLIDLQNPLELTDNQMVKLKPIMGQGLHSMVKVLFENAGTRLTLPKKVSIGNQIKKIQKKTDDGVRSVLTSGQYETWQAMKEEAKNSQG